MLFPLVSIIIVGYNNARDLPTCLESLKSTKYPNFEVIFVDNCSTDDSRQVITNNFPWVKIVDNPQNSGFGLGCNLGAKYSKGTFLVFLNPDTRVDPSWLNELVLTANSDANVAACGSTILFWAGNKIQSLGGKLNCETGYTIDIGFGLDYKKNRFNRGGSVFHCCGASLLVKATAFFEAGGFPEDYFLYFDEVDLCWRIRLLGYDIQSVPSSIVYHKIDPVRAHSAKARYLVERNSLRTFIKNSGSKNLLKYGCIITFFRMSAFTFLFFRKKTNYAIPIFRGFIDALVDFGNIWKSRLEVQKMRKLDDRHLLTMPYLVSLKELLFFFFSDVVPFFEAE